VLSLTQNDLRNLEAFKVMSENSIAELTMQEKQTVNLWKKVTALSKSPRTAFRFEEYQHSNIMGLFKFMDFCGIPRQKFIRSYLYQLQPFMIHLPEANSSKQDKFACIIDSSYRTPLWIEVIYKQCSEAVVSFHEMNRQDCSLDSLGYYPDDQIICVPNSSLKTLSTGDFRYFNISVLKGFNSFELKVYGIKITNTFIRVKREEYERKLLLKVNEQLEEILHSVRQETADFPDFSKEKSLSFTSFGEDLAMTVSMLLDLYLTSKDGSVSSVLSVKAQQLASLPNSEPVINELLKHIEQAYKLDLRWLL